MREAKWFIFTIWIREPGNPNGSGYNYVDRHVLRLQGPVDEPDHETLKTYVVKQTQVSRPDAVVEFGPIGLSKRQ